MVMNAVSLNLMTGTAKQSGTTESDSGFSSVLDNVSSESRQQGCAAQRKSEFKYTEKAVDAGKEAVTEGGSESFGTEYSAYSDSSLKDAAEMVLDEAAAIVSSVLRKSDDKMSESKIKDMLIETVKTIIEQKKNENDDGRNIDAILEMLMAILGGQSVQTEESMQTFFAAYSETDIRITTVQVSVHEVSVKHEEAAMLTEGEAAAMTSVSGDAALTSDDMAAESGLMKTDMAEQEIMPETAAENEETVTAGEQPTAVNDNLSALNEILAKAKEELGLTEAKVTTVVKEELPEETRTEQPAETSVRMSRDDRSGELDYILSGGKEEHNTVKTETYDAVHMAAEFMQDRSAVGEANIPEQLPQTEQVARPPEVQAAEQIIARMETMRSGETEFTMVLNPESLGRITVKLVTAGERVAVEITAENPETRELLAARTESLQNMLRDNGVQLERYQVVEEQEDAELMQQNYDGSSRNPYGRQQEQENEDEDGDNFYDILQQI